MGSDLTVRQSRCEKGVGDASCIMRLASPISPVSDDAVLGDAHDWSLLVDDELPPASIPLVGGSHVG